MKISDEEKRMLEGSCGRAIQKAMQIVVAMGECFGADHLIDVESCHLPGASYMLLGEAGLKFVEEMGRSGDKVKVLTTTNPTSCDNALWRELGMTEKHLVEQKKVTDAYERLGVTTISCCSPYLTGNKPRFGQHIAWGESSAVVYANSVLGARTNREGGPGALAAAMTGKTAAYGLHLKRNRYAKVLVNVPRHLHGDAAYGLLGFSIGSVSGANIPVFTGISPSDITNDELKSLGAALATSGAVPAFHMVGVTPEADTLSDALGRKKPEIEIEYTKAMEEDAKKHLNSSKDPEVDWLYIGCPQCSIDEISKAASLLDGRHIHEGVDFWICTSIPVLRKAENLGYAKKIRDAGALLVCQTCPAHAPNKDLIKVKGYTSFTTDSAKMAHYAMGEVGLQTHFGTTEEVVEAAISKIWRYDHE